MNIRKLLDTALDGANHLVFGRIALLAIVLTISIMGSLVKGTYNVVDMTQKQGINLFEHHYVIGDFKANCQVLIDSDYNVLETKPYESWRDSSCIDYSDSKSTLMILVLDHQLGARNKLYHSAGVFFAFFVFFILYALHATTPSSFIQDTPKITPRSLCILWIILAVFLFPFTFRQHSSLAQFERDATEYTTYTVYTDKDGGKFSCPTPFFAKLQEIKCTPYKW